MHANLKKIEKRLGKFTVLLPKKMLVWNDEGGDFKAKFEDLEWLYGLAGYSPKITLTAGSEDTAPVWEVSVRVPASWLDEEEEERVPPPAEARSLGPAPVRWEAVASNAPAPRSPQAQAFLEASSQSSRLPRAARTSI